VTAVLEGIELVVGTAVGVAGGTAVVLAGTAVGVLPAGTAAVVAGTAAVVAGTVAAGSVKDSLTKKTAACPVKTSDEIQRNLLKGP